MGPELADHVLWTPAIPGMFARSVVDLTTDAWPRQGERTGNASIANNCLQLPAVRPYRGAVLLWTFVPIAVMLNKLQVRS
jgi:hypothetical protein